MFARLHDQRLRVRLVHPSHFGQLVHGQIGQVVARMNTAIGQFFYELRRQAFDLNDRFVIDHAPNGFTRPVVEWRFPAAGHVTRKRKG